MYLSATLGYSLVKTSPNYIGNLRVSQLYALFNGMAECEKKKSDSMKHTGKPGRIELTKGNIHNFPGVKIIKKKVR